MDLDSLSERNTSFKVRHSGFANFIASRRRYSGIRSLTVTDRYVDLLKQGFMKPKKVSKKLYFQHWLPNEEGISYEGQNESQANLHKMKYGGIVKKVRK